jgi:hypothetical protein
MQVAFIIHMDFLEPATTHQLRSVHYYAENFSKDD